MALFEAKRPAAIEQITELLRTSGDYLLLTETKGTIAACGEASLAKQGVDPAHCPEARIQEAAITYLAEHGGVKTSFGYLIREADSPWAQPGTPLTWEPHISVQVMDGNDAIDSVILPMADEELEAHKLDDGSEIDPDNEKIYSVHSSHMPLLNILGPDCSIRELNRAAQSLREMDPIHLGRLVEKCSQIQERGVQALIDAAAAAVQDFQRPADGGMRIV